MESKFFDMGFIFTALLISFGVFGIALGLVKIGELFI